jgi:hypothetical protein
MSIDLVPTEVELQLLEACRQGDELSLKTNNPAENSAADGHAWTKGREVRAEFIARLLTTAPGPVVNLKGAKIVGSLNLAGHEVRIPMVLGHCWFENPIQLHHAQTRTVVLRGCCFPSLSADAAAISGDLSLSEITCSGSVSLVDADISGSLYLDSARFIRDVKKLNLPVLNCNRIHVGRAVLAGKGFLAHGMVTFIDGEIGKSFEAIEKCSLLGFPNAFVADRLRIGGALLVRKEIEIGGDFRIDSVVIQGACIFEDVRIATGVAGKPSPSTTELEPEVANSQQATVPPPVFSGTFLEVGDHLTFDRVTFGKVRLSAATVGAISWRSVSLLEKEQTCADLRGVQIKTHLSITGSSVFGGRMDLTACGVARTCAIQESEFSFDGDVAIAADGMQIGDHLQLGPALRAASEIRFIRSTIGLSCTVSANLAARDRNSLTLDEARIGSNLVLTKDTILRGCLGLQQVNIRGMLVAEGVRIQVQKGPAINGFGATIGSALRIEGCVLTGERVMFSGAHVEGPALIARSQFYPQEARIDFQQSQLRSGISIVACAPCAALSFTDAEVGGDFTLSSGLMVETLSMNLSRAKIAGDVNLDNLSSVKGRVVCVATELGGSFRTGALFSISAADESSDHSVMDLSKSSIQGDLSLRFVSINGGLDLTRATIGRDLDLSSAQIVPRPPDAATDQDRGREYEALSARGLKVSGKIDLGFANINGAATLSGCQIGGDLSCILAEFKSDLDLHGTTVLGDFIWQMITSSGYIDLTSAHVGNLVDDVESWPKNAYSIVDFEYSIRGDADRPAVPQLAWIQNQNPWSPQPYEFAARWLRLRGKEGSAKTLQRARRNDERKFGSLSMMARLWNRVLDVFAGHGYQMWRIPGWAALVILVGTVVFYSADKQGVMVMVKSPDAAMQPASGSKNTKPLSRQELNYPQFDAFTYSLDVFLPVVDLHQESSYLPVGNRPGRLWYESYLRFQILLGWFMTTLTVAALSGLNKKD